MKQRRLVLKLTTYGTVENLRAVGIVAEYNPFHNGHYWHLQQARELTGNDFVVVVMSGNFMQRGEPAIYDKWSRAQMAVMAGADLVIELPVVFAVRSAEYFAGGGVRLLNSLGIVSHICFGAEHPELSILSALADATGSESTTADLHRYLDEGINYADALGKALQDNTGAAKEIVASPNNILAIEYLRAIKRFAPTIIPQPIARRVAGYHDEKITGPIASATAIRHAIIEAGGSTGIAASALPPESLQVIEKIMAEQQGPITYSAFSQLILAKLRTTGLEQLEQLPEVSEGLHHKLKNSALTAGDTDELLTMLKVKRYPRTRLQRILIHALLSTNKSQLRQSDASGPLYARVLAFNCRGRQLLSRMADISTVPVITKTTHYLSSSRRHKHRLSPLEEMLAVDTLASDMYVLGMPTSAGRRGGWDFRRTPEYIPCLPSNV